MALAGVLAVICLFYADVLLGRRAFFFRDTFQANEPQRRLLAAALREGRLPWWNPLAHAGVPFLADSSTATLYPLNLPYAVLDFDAWFQGSIVLHFLIAAAGVLLLAWTWGWRPVSCAVTALAFGFSTPLVLLSGNIMYLGVAWMPFHLAALTRALQGPARARWTALAAAALALQVLAGDVQGAHTTLLLGAGWLAVLAAPGRWRVALGVGAGSAGLAALLAGAAWVPAWEFLRVSDRSAGLAYDDAVAWSLHPLRLLELAWPLLCGGHAGFQPQQWWGAWLHNSVDGSPWNSSVSAGLVALLLAAWGLWGARGDPRATLLRVALPVTLLLALGAYAPAYRAFRAVVPLASSFRYPEKYALPAVFLLALAAGLGMERVLARDGRMHRFVAAALALACLPWLGALGGGRALTAALAALPLTEVRAGFDPVAATESLRGVLWHAVLVCTALLLLTAWHARDPRGARAPLGVLALLLVDVADHASAVRYATSPALYALPAGGDGLAVPLLRAPERHFRIHREAFQHGPTATWPGPDLSPYERQRFFEKATLERNTGWNYGLAYAGAFGAARFGRFARLQDAGVMARLLPVMNVRYLVVDEGMAVFRAPPYEPIAHAAALGALLVRDIRALPRAAWFPRAEKVATEQAALAWLADRAHDVLTGLVVEHPGGVAEGGAGRAEVVALEAEHVRIRVTSDGPGWLFVSDAFAPGWTAWADGVEVPVHAADVVFRAVWLPGGDHDVEMRYRPGLWSAGLTLSVLGLVVFAGALVCRRRRRCPR